MSDVLSNIRKKILGDAFYDKCIKGQTLSQEELQTVADKYDLTISDVTNICRFKTKHQIDAAKTKILGDTNVYCQESSIHLPKREVFKFKQHTLQKILTDEEFLYLCKTTGWYEEAIQIIMNLILFDVQGKLIQGQTQKIVNNLRQAHVSLELEESKKNEKNISRNLTIIKNTHSFFSSIPYDVLKEDFENLRILWCSPEISQSILFMLGNEKSLIHPCFFEFKFNKSLFLLNSTDLDNTNIFDDVLDQESIRKIKKAFDFDFGNNIHILCVIEAINRITKIQENNPSLKLHGYRNRFDQNEIALIDFYKLVDKSSIRKGIFEKVILKNIRYSEPDDVFVFKFPFLHKTFFHTYKLKTDFEKNKHDLIDFVEDDFHIFQTYEIKFQDKETSVYRAACPLAKYELIYFYEDDKNTKYVFHCDEEDLENNDDVILYDLITI